MRRRFVIGGAAALAALATPRTPRANPLARRIALRHAGSGARFSGIWHNGRAPDRGAMAELSRVLADPGVGQPVPFSPDALAIAWELVQRTGFDTEADVHSGYRDPVVNRNANGVGDSQHLRAAALDIGVRADRLPGVGAAAVEMGRGGVGVYLARGFIHLDSGPVRSWGEAALVAAPSPFTPRGRELTRGASFLRQGSPLRLDTQLYDPNPLGLRFPQVTIRRGPSGR